MSFVDKRVPVILPSPMLLQTLRRVGRWHPDVVVTNTRFFSSSVLGVFLARIWRTPMLHIDHASGHVLIGSKIGDAISEGIDHIFGSWVIRRATRCVGVSRSVADFMRHFGRNDAGVLYNGVDTCRFNGATSEWRQRLGIDDGECMLLYAGRLISDKGVDVLVDAFLELPESPRVRLVIAGDGPLMSMLRLRVASDPRVHLLGFVGSEDVRALLASADVFVHPSAYPEGLPTAVLEAAAAGKAIVATPMGGTEEVVASPDLGVIVAPRDTRALGEALGLLVADAELRTRLGRAVQEHCRRVFDWERVADVAEGELLTLIRTQA